MKTLRVFGIIFAVIFLPLSISTFRHNFMTEHISFNTTPSYNLAHEEWFAIDLDAVFNSFATIEVISHGTTSTGSTMLRRNRSTVRVYYAIKTYDGKVMALAVPPELADEVNLRWENTLARSQGGGRQLEPLRLLGQIYPIDTPLIYGGGGEYHSSTPRTPPSALLNDYINGNNYRDEAELRLIQNELNKWDYPVHPYVLAVRGGNASRIVNFVFYLAIGLIGVWMIIKSTITIRREKRKAKEVKA